MKKALTLFLALVMTLSLVACGGGSGLVEKVEVAKDQYFMVYDSGHSFAHEPEDLPKSGIIVISNDGNYLHVYNGSGKETVNINSKLWREHAAKETVVGGKYQRELSFVNECLTGCMNAAPYETGTELETNTWYIKK